MKQILFALPLLAFTNFAYAECSTFPPYWCDDGSYAEDLMDAINQNNLDIGMENIRQQRGVAERALRLKIQENLKWLTESEGRSYVSVSQNAGQTFKACSAATMMRALFATKLPVRGDQADQNCQQAAANNIKEVRYESLAFYRKSNKIIPSPKGADNPEGRDSLAARAYRNKRFEDDLMTLPPESRREIRALNDGLEADMKLCAEQADALACHDMVAKPFTAAFKEFASQMKGGRRNSAEYMAPPVQPASATTELRRVLPMPKDLIIPDNGEYDPYATQKWSCKVGYSQVENRCQKR